MSAVVALAALMLGACESEDAFTKSKRQQAERECTREQEQNLNPGESYEDCVKRWFTQLGD